MSPTAASRVRVLIGTTEGPVELLDLRREPAIVRRSVVSVRSTIERAGIERGYHSFVSGKDGIVAELFGKGAFRVDVSARIDAGCSWQLGLLLAHALHYAGRLGGTHEIVLWATGTVRPDLSIGEVGHVPQKLVLSLDRFRAEAALGRSVLVLLPSINASEIDRALRHDIAASGAKLIEVDQISQALRALELPPVERKISAADRVWHGSPYRSLEPFEAQHRDIFFGRGRAREEALERLRRAAASNVAFLLVHGRSGSGKSSLVRAGLVGDVLAQASEADIWRVAVTTPRRGGLSPMSAVIRALIEGIPELLCITAWDEAGARDAFAKDPEGATAAMRSALDQISRGQRAKLLLVIDQLEELLLWGGGDDVTDTAVEREAFGAAITALCRSGAVWVIATLRSDLLSRLEDSPELSRLAGDDRLYRLERPTRVEIKQIVLRPAASAQLRLEGADPTGLPFPEVLIEAAAAAPDSLPLLQVVLARMFESEGSTGKLTYAAYARLGSLEGAIARWADDVRGAIATDSSRSAALEQLVLQLGRWDPEAGLVVSRLVHLDRSTHTETYHLAEEMAAARLVTLDSQGPHATVRLAHETLLSAWPWAADLFARRRRELELRDRMEQQATAWESASRDATLLLRAGRLMEDARALIGENSIQVGDSVRTYVLASIEAAEKEARAEHQRLETEAKSARRRAGMAMAAAAAMVVITALAWWQRQIATQQQAIAFEQRNIAVESGQRAALERDRSLVSQSRFLAQLSQTRMAAGDDVGAVLVALEALPDARNDSNRPYVPEAERALFAACTSQRELAIFSGHLGPVMHAAVTPDGRFLLTASRDSTARLWDIETRQQRKIFKAPDAALVTAAISPETRRIVAVTEDGLLVQWNVDTTELISSPSFEGRQVTHAQYTNSGKAMLLRFSSGTAAIIDSTTGQILRELRGAATAQFDPAQLGLGQGSSILDGTHATALNADLTLIATAQQLNAAAYYNAAVYVWDTSTGRLAGRFEKHNDHVRSLSFSPDGTLVASASEDFSVAVWEPGSGTVVKWQKGHGDDVLHVAFDARGARLVSTSRDGSVLVWSPKGDDTSTIRLAGHNAPVLFAGFHPDGERLVTTSEDGTIRLWDIRPGKLNDYEITIGDSSRQVRSVAAGARLVADEILTTVPTWDRSRCGEAGVVRSDIVNGIVLPAFVSPDGLRLFTFHKGLSGRVWDALKLEPILEIPLPPPSTGLGINAYFSQNGGRLLVEVSDRGKAEEYRAKIGLWDADTGRQLAELESTANLRDAVFTANGTKVVVLADDVDLLDATNGNSIRKLVKGSKGYRVDFSPDGSRLILLRDRSVLDQFLRSDQLIVVSAETGETIAVLQATSDIAGARFTPDGKQLVLSTSTAVEVWETTTFTRSHLLALSGSPRVLDISSDGKRMVVGTESAVLIFRIGESQATHSLPGGATVARFALNETRLVLVRGYNISVMDLLSDKSLQQLEAYGEIRSLTLSPDGRRLGIGGGLEAPVIIDLASGRVVAELKGHHRNDETNMVFADGGKRIFTTGLDESGGRVQVWRTFNSPQDLVSAVQSAAPRCLDPIERSTFFLSQPEPAWCLSARKWPYEADVFRSRALGKLRAATEENDQSVLPPALDDLDRAVALAPTRAEIFAERALVLGKLGRLEDAVSSLDRALAINPREPNFLVRRGWLALQLKRYASGRSDAEAALELKTHHPPALTLRGFVLLAEGEVERALVDFSSAAKLEPNTLMNQLGHGISLEAKGELHQARAIYDRILGMRAVTDEDRIAIEQAWQLIRASKP